MGCIAVAILRTRALPRWTGYIFLIATVLLLGQYAVFRGALPFPQFLAFIAIGIAALVHRTSATSSPSREPADLAARTDSCHTTVRQLTEGDIRNRFQVGKGRASPGNIG
jgi:hypothetical protein